MPTTMPELAVAVRATPEERLLGDAEQAAELLGIPVHDHLVIGDGCFVSMAERGLI